MIIMQVAGLSIDSSSKATIVLLKSIECKKTLSIWVGAMEAMSISLALSQQNMPRPLTHDLTLSMLDAVGASVKGLEIHKFEKGTFYADILVYREGSVYRIDCRPSDGIALALRSASLIAVHPQVIQVAQHVEQVQDGTSFQLLKEEAPKMKPASNLIPKVVHKVQPMPKPHVQTVTSTKDEEELAKLLKSMEPLSTRRM